MRWLPVLLLAAVVTSPAAAEDNEAEKLFKRMDNKLRAARTLRCRFDSTLTMDGKTIPIKGTLTLGEGNRMRLEGEIKPADESVKLLVVCDGARLASKDSADGKKVETREAPKGLGPHARVMLPRYGVGVLWNSLNRPRFVAASPDLDRVSDFKLGEKKEIGKRRTREIEYTVTRKIDVVSPPKTRVKVWIDLETGLPVKLVADYGKDADISAGTDSYADFSVDGKVDEKTFKLPK